MTWSLGFVAVAWAAAAAAWWRAHRATGRATGRGAGRNAAGAAGPWLVAGAAVAAGVAVVAAGFGAVGGWGGAPAVAVAGTAAVPLALAAAVVPALAPGGTLVARATVGAAGLAALAVATWLVVAAGPAGMPRHEDRVLGAWSLAAALAVAALAPGARRALQGWAARAVGVDDGPGTAPLRSFGGRLTRAVPMDELLLQLAETVRRGAARRRAEVWLLDGDVLTCAAEVPHRSPASVVLGERARPVGALLRVTGGAWVRTWLPELVAGGAGDAEGPDRVRCAPLAHRGKVLGLLLAERGPGEPPFSDEDDRVLGDLARQVGTALRNVQLDSALEATVDELRGRNAELQGSRARLVSVADAERRRLERDLHDGAQQHLTALGVKLELAAALAGDAPETKASFAELRHDLDEARAQLRALAHGIFPPLLTIGGLADALPHLASRAPLPVTVDVPPTRWDAEAEAAVYFCCSEALQNVGKHAGPGARASVRVWDDAGALRFSVHDDGAGFATTGSPSARTSHGLVNMADRLGALGGELVVASAPGAGTTVAGTIPPTAPTAPTTPAAPATSPGR